MEIVEEHSAHGGRQRVYSHQSLATGTEMRFAAYIPPHEEGARLPLLWYLSGLTCTHANVMEKGEYRAACAEHGIVFVAPDTSPRGKKVPDSDDYDLGQGAGFYLDATQKPWAKHFQMRSYIEDELPSLVARELPVDMDRQAISGHSMGGHGALTIALRNPGRFRSISAFAPIAAPSRVPWGEKAFTAYLGDHIAAWREYDALALVEDGAKCPAPIKISQGLRDEFLEKQLKPELFKNACADAGIECDLTLDPDGDHSYYFISSEMPAHLAFHAKRLKA